MEAEGDGKVPWGLWWPGLWSAVPRKMDGFWTQPFCSGGPGGTSPTPTPVPKTSPLPEPLVPLDQPTEWVWPGQGGGRLSWQEKTEWPDTSQSVSGLIEMLVFI